MVCFINGSLSLDNSNEKQPLKHFIQACCRWGHKLANGTPYKIIGADAGEQQAVRSAVYKWNIKLKAIKITEASTNVNADIQVSFNSTAQKLEGSFGGVSALALHTLSAITAGQSINNFDENGFMTSVKISISRSTFGNILGLSEIEQITEYEIGHALGLGNANSNDDLMSVVVSSESGSISKCDIDAIIGVNRWKLMESGSIPRTPRCRSYKLLKTSIFILR